MSPHPGMPALQGQALALGLSMGEVPQFTAPTSQERANRWFLSDSTVRALFLSGTALVSHSKRAPVPNTVFAGEEKGGEHMLAVLNNCMVIFMVKRTDVRVNQGVPRGCGLPSSPVNASTT